MAKRDIYKGIKYFPSRSKIYQQYSGMYDSEDGINRANNARVNGPRVVIVKAFDEHGTNGAWLAFKMLEKRRPGIYTWEMIEKWLEEDRNYVPETKKTNPNNDEKKIKGEKCEYTL